MLAPNSAPNPLKAWLELEAPVIKRMEQCGDMALTLALFGLAAFCIVVALRPNRPALKALVFGWLILP